MRERALSEPRAAPFARGLAAVFTAGALACLALGLRADEKAVPPQSPVAALADMLLGTLRGSSPGNDLTIVTTRAATPTSQLALLDVRVTGTYQGDAVLLRGLWRISYQGEAVWLVLLPEADRVGSDRRYSGSAFSPTEVNTGCWTILAPRGAAFEGTIRPFPNCRNAIGASAVQSVEKEWSVRVGQDGIRLRNRETDEILSFTRAAKK